MIQRIINLVFAGLLFSCLVNSAELLDQIVAQVDQWGITRMDLEEACASSIAQIKQEYPKDQWKSKTLEIKNKVLGQMINEYVCMAVARELELSVSDDEIDFEISMLMEKAGIQSLEEFESELAREGLTLDEFKKSKRKQSTMRKVLQREVYSKIKVSNVELEDYYHIHEDIYRKPAQVKVGLILLKVVSERESDWEQTGETALEIFTKLESGVVFSKMVRDFSEGPSKEQGGDIGFIEKGKGLPEFEEVAFGLQTNEISKPFRTTHGWNIIKILDRIEESVHPFTEVSSDIKALLKSLKASEQINEWFEQQRKKVFIQTKPIEDN